MAVLPTHNVHRERRLAISSRRGSKKVTRAFKIEQNLDDAIQAEARKAGITPSSLVSQILTRHVKWVKYTGLGSTFLTIDREVMGSFVEEIDEDRLVELARSLALVSTHNFLKFRYQKINVETVLDFLEALSSYSNFGEIRVVSDEKRESEGFSTSLEINIRHSLGMKWSIFLSEYLAGMLSSFLEFRTTTEVSQLGCTVTAVRSDLQ